MKPLSGLSGYVPGLPNSADSHIPNLIRALIFGSWVKLFDEAQNSSNRDCFLLSVRSRLRPVAVRSGFS